MEITGSVLRTDQRVRSSRSVRPMRCSERLTTLILLFEIFLSLLFTSLLILHLALGDLFYSSSPLHYLGALVSVYGHFSDRVF
jgi:hypothetical protein